MFQLCSFSLSVHEVFSDNAKVALWINSRRETSNIQAAIVLNQICQWIAARLSRYAWGSNNTRAAPWQVEILRFSLSFGSWTVSPYISVLLQKGAFCLFPQHFWSCITQECAEIFISIRVLFGYNKISPFRSFGSWRLVSRRFPAGFPQSQVGTSVRPPASCPGHLQANTAI